MYIMWKASSFSIIIASVKFYINTLHILCFCGWYKLIKPAHCGSFILLCAPRFNTSWKHSCFLPLKESKLYFLELIWIHQTQSKSLHAIKNMTFVDLKRWWNHKAPPYHSNTCTNDSIPCNISYCGSKVVIYQCPLQKCFNVQWNTHIPSIKSAA